jgi:epoxide hydrolase-like predicted phosphatase
MPIRAVVFDIGGVLEITPRTGWVEKWEARLEYAPGTLGRQLGAAWRPGAVGEISEAEVYRRTAEILGADAEQVHALMEDMWAEYLGTLNVELVEWCRGLRPRHRTAILSNSFVGARAREQERYGFEELVDLTVYSHEVGLAKPDRRVYALTCERLGVLPEETAFLDDFEPWVEAARDFGIHAVLFRDNAQVIAEIDSLLASA